MNRLSRIHTIATVAYALAGIAGFVAIMIGINNGFSAYTEIGLHNDQMGSILQYFLVVGIVCSSVIGFILRSLEKDIFEELKYYDPERQKTKR